MRMRRVIGIFLSFALLTAWLGFLWAENNEGSFGTLAEGLTSSSSSERITARERMFTIYDLRELCKGPQPSRLIPREDHVQIKIGNMFSLQDLSVVAVNSAGEIMKPIPIILDTDARSDLIDASAFRANADGIRALQPGRFHVRIRPLCSGSEGPQAVICYTVE